MTNSSSSSVFSDRLGIPFTAERLYHTLERVLDRKCNRESGYMAISFQGKSYKIYIRLKRIGRTLAFYGYQTGQAPWDFEFCRGTLRRKGGTVTGVIDLFAFKPQRAG